MGPDSGPTPDPLSLCHDDINPIVTCFNAVIKIVLKRIFVFFVYIELGYCQLLPYGLIFEIKYMQSMIAQICS